MRKRRRGRRGRKGMAEPELKIPIRREGKGKKKKKKFVSWDFLAVFSCS
jgi:hypothetical protein